MLLEQYRSSDGRGRVGGLQHYTLCSAYNVCIYNIYKCLCAPI